MRVVQATLNLALQCFQERRLAESEALYRRAMLAPLAGVRDVVFFSSAYIAAKLVWRF